MYNKCIFVRLNIVKCYNFYGDIMDLYTIARKKMQYNLSDKYNEETLVREYEQYIDTLLSFEGNKDNIIEILNIYGDQLQDYIRSNFIIKENIMFSDRHFRNDLDFDEHVDLDEVFSSILYGRELTGFSRRAKDILIFEIMNMYNLYGIEMLRNNPKLISKEIDYGIFFNKCRNKEENFGEIIRLGDKYGKDAIVHLENLELLQKRIDSLFDISSEEMLPELSKLHSSVEQCLIAKNDPNSTLELNADALKTLYERYEMINKLTIKHLMSGDIPHTISKPTGQLLMLHFIQDGTDKMTDANMNKFLNEEILFTAKRMISKCTGREYDEMIDSEKLNEILLQYKNSRENPFDFESRIPLRCKYVGKRSLFSTITKPMTLLSVSLSTPEKLSIHLDRKIAIGFIPEDIPIESITSTCSVFNPEKDRYDFKKDSHSISEIMEMNETNTKSNETLVDWTKIKPGYIFVIKDQEVLEPEIIKRAQELQEKNNLPIVVYDRYSLNMNNNKSI